ATTSPRAPRRAPRVARLRRVDPGPPVAPVVAGASRRGGDREGGVVVAIAALARAVPPDSCGGVPRPRQSKGGAAASRRDRERLDFRAAEGRGRATAFV